MIRCRVFWAHLRLIEAHLSFLRKKRNNTTEYNVDGRGPDCGEPGDAGDTGDPFWPCHNWQTRTKQSVRRQRRLHSFRPLLSFWVFRGPLTLSLLVGIRSTRKLLACYPCPHRCLSCTFAEEETRRCYVGISECDADEKKKSRQKTMAQKKQKEKKRNFPTRSKHAKQTVLDQERKLLS
jgi:hypothetical protein